MLEIEFRGKQIAPGEMQHKFVYGDLIRSRGKFYINPHCNGITVNGHLGQLVVMHEISIQTIGQYAGYHDDSDDQVKVYEGDVVQFEYEGEGHTCEVKHEGSGFMFVGDSLPDGYLWVSELIEFDRSYCWAEGVMVVGIIHDDGLAPKEGVEQ
ncbi:hypothetical protein [Paenibacillus amylolyticus]|uniref:YopX protein domain-containing protein n=1 Tax=Paenibacillus amylolyticus TaxID=1451 RepID=A0A100VMF4_PAEAM|nr:hypothetical protein [Paenibacillus amylolyticus]GAS82424.1 unknown protein [Paenibacillus amylolyticus]